MIKKLYNWWFGVNVSMYQACSITGLTGQQIWKEYRARKRVYRRHGIRVTSPIPGEGIKDNNRVVGNRPGEVGTKLWAKDKKQIKDTNVFVFPLLKRRSQGCEFELAKARGTHWKITVYIHDKPGFISKEQGDIVCSSDSVAAKLIIRKFGSRHKRAIWRLKMLYHSLPGWILQQLKEFII